MSFQSAEFMDPGDLGNGFIHDRIRELKGSLGFLCSSLYE